MEMKDLKILGIDTSTKMASIAITDDNNLIWEKSVFTKLTHSQIILPMVNEALDECEIDFPQIDCISVAKGPGSYTGLRIGIGAVKGICMGIPEIRCAGVSTLQSLAYNCLGFQGNVISVMRARPGIVYKGIFYCNYTKLERISEDTVCSESFFEELEFSRNTMIVGDCSREIKEKYFKENNMVICASKSMNYQRAYSLCLAVYDNPQIITSAELLNASYLQETKAEKDILHK